MNHSTKRIALVIGSGSVKCAAAIGLYAVLARADIRVDLVVGCSGGSLYAALIALGYDAAASTEMTQRLWTREITRQRSYRDFLSILLPGVFQFSEKFGLLDDRLAMQRLRAVFGNRTFADAKIPLHLTATDFATGDQVVLSRGNLVDAIRASIAIPYIFKPHRIDDRLLLDGYLSDPMPVGVAIKEGADIILAMGFESTMQTRVNSLPRYAFQLSSIASNNLLKANFAFHNLAHHGEVIPIIPQFTQRVGLFATEQIPSVIEQGAQAMQAQLPYLQQLLHQ